MEITNKKSVYQHIYFNINHYENKIGYYKHIYFISYIMKINYDITSTDIFFIILHENKLKIL